MYWFAIAIAIVVAIVIAVTPRLDRGVHFAVNFRSSYDLHSTLLSTAKWIPRSSRGMTA